MILKRFALTNMNRFEAKLEEIIYPEKNLFDGLKSLKFGDNFTN